MKTKPEPSLTMFSISTRKMALNSFLRRTLTVLSLSGALLALSVSLLAADGTYIGPATSGLDTTSNWSSGTVPASTTTTSDTATFNGTTSGALTLSEATANAFGGGSGTLGALINVTSGQISAVTLTGQSIRLAGVTIASGAGAVTFSNTVLFGGGGAATTNTITNDSANAVTFTTVTPGGGVVRTLDFEGAGNSNITGNIASTANIKIQKGGAGTLNLSGANAYSGGTTINGGILKVSNAGALGTSGNITFGGGTLQYNTASTNDYSSRIKNSTSGAITIDTNSNNVTFAGALDSSNTGGLTKSGAGTLTLSVANAYTGDTTLNTGTLAINNATAISTGTLNITGGSIDNTSGNAITLTNNNAQTWNGSFTFTGSADLNLGTGAVSLGTATGTTRTVTVAANTLTVGGVISNGTTANSLTAGGSGTLALNEFNTYTSTTTVGAGATLAVSHLANGGSASGIGASTAAGSNLSLSNGATLKYTGSGDSTDRRFTISSTAAGSTGTLDASGSGAINFTSNSTSPASIAYGGTNVTHTLILTGTNTGANTLAAPIGNNGAGAVSVTKNGTGTWALSGTSTYTGPTTVNAGTLVVGLSGAGSLTSSVTVNAGTLAGSGSTTGAVAIGNSTGTSDSFLAPGNSAGTFTTTSILTLNSDATYSFELNSTTPAADKVVANGVTIIGASFSFTDLGNGSGVTDGMQFVVIDNTSGSAISGTFANLAQDQTISSNGVTYTASYVGGIGGNDLVLTAAAVPEPNTWAMFFGGLGMLVAFQRSRCRMAK